MGRGVVVAKIPLSLVPPPAGGKETIHRERIRGQPMANAVLVTDMLRGFMEEGRPLYCGADARRIIPNIQRLLEKELTVGSKVFFVCDHHDEDDIEFRIFPPHCIADTVETEVIPELAQFPGEIARKKRYSSFAGTDLAQRLKKFKPDKIIICGVCTDICVCHTAADARNLDYPVEVPADCVASFDEKAHAYALQHMEKVLGVRVIENAPQALPTPRFKPAAAVLSGDTADVYFPRAIEILKKEGLNPVATMEVFGRRAGVLCGIEEAKALLKAVLPDDCRAGWAWGDGDPAPPKWWGGASMPPLGGTASTRRRSSACCRTAPAGRQRRGSASGRRGTFR
jgi:nicotinamidase-related amidase